MKLTILGTSCMVPTKERNVSGYYLDYNGEGILFDCGEGTQRQMNIAARILQAALNVHPHKIRYPNYHVSSAFSSSLRSTVRAAQILCVYKAPICKPTFLFSRRRSTARTS